MWWWERDRIWWALKEWAPLTQLWRLSSVRVEAPWMTESWDYRWGMDGAEGFATIRVFESFSLQRGQTANRGYSSHWAGAVYKEQRFASPVLWEDFFPLFSVDLPSAQLRHWGWENWICPCVTLATCPCGLQCCKIWMALFWEDTTILVYPLSPIMALRVNKHILSESTRARWAPGEEWEPGFVLLPFWSLFGTTSKFSH